jgi:hypothetical protein
MACNMDDADVVEIGLRIKRRGSDKPRDMIYRDHIDRVVYLWNRSELNAPLDKSDQKIVRIRHCRSVSVA